MRKKFPAGPVRSCLACRQRLAKESLWRLSHDGEQTVVIDHNKVRPGRGAYWCGAEKCGRQLKKNKKRLAWALRVHSEQIKDIRIP